MTTTESTMCIHRDCRYIDDPAAIRTVPVPAGTTSWCPVGHGAVRRTLVRGMQDRGMSIAGERWALSAARGDLAAQNRPDAGVGAEDREVFTGYGARAFGLLEFKSIGVGGQADDYNLAIGVRNSYDKTLALGIAVGASVFICDNLILSGEQVAYRKHTSGINIDDEAVRAIDSVMPTCRAFELFMGRMKNAAITGGQFDSIVCDSIRAGIMPGTSALNVLRAWHDGEPPASPLRNDNGFAGRLTGGVYADRTAWSAHNVFTDLVFKRWSLTGYGNDMIARSRDLNGVFAKNVPALALN